MNNALDIESKSLKDQLRHLLKQYSSIRNAGDSRPAVPLAVPSYSLDEIAEAVDSLLAGQVTMGEKVMRFERLFSEYLGVKHSVMVNSGSSANLIALSILTNPTVPNRIKPGDEVIVPAVAWSTTIFPVAQVGARPVLVDVRLDDYNIDVAEVERAITPRTRAIVPVHLLGNPCQMDAINELASSNRLFVMEDACEAHGAEYLGRKAGSFGDIGTFSFYLSHHITTIEGGMVVTNNDQFAELARTLRAHGWIRELNSRSKIASQYPTIDSRFLFVNLGFNVRPTEIQGAFGIHQMGKLENFIAKRRTNADFWSERLANYSHILRLPPQEEPAGTRRVWFGYPVSVREGAGFNRKQLTDFLEKSGIETRPVMAGNLEEQPAMRLIEHRTLGDLPNAKEIMRRAFFWGNHAAVGEEERVYVADTIRGFLEHHNPPRAAAERSSPRR